MARRGLRGGAGWSGYAALMPCQPTKRAQFAGVLLTLAVFGLPVADPACEPDPSREEVTFDERETRRILRLSPLPALPPDPTNTWADDPRAAQFGQFLFYEKRLSLNGELSCASCHKPELDWADGVSLGEGLGPGRRHTPSLWNVAYNRWYFWDGRADSLWAQASAPIENPNELGSSRVRLTHLLAESAPLRKAYEDLFGPLPDAKVLARLPKSARPVPDAPDDPESRSWAALSAPDREAVTRVLVNVAKAIAAFERKLVSGEAPFDRFVAGLRENDAARIESLSVSAQRGLKLFIGKGKCHLCHHGALFSDREFHNILLPPLDEQTPFDPGRHRGIDLLRADPLNGVGRFSDRTDGDVDFKVGYLSQKSEDYASFKTPSLRNVARTAPYMHGGQFESLERVLHFYSTFEGAVNPRGHHEQILKPLELDEGETQDLIEFLGSLSAPAADESLTRQPDRP